MQDKQHNVKSKQPYKKPKLRTIELAAEEVLGIGCKTAPGAPGPGITCTDGSCSLSLGS
jgi:hypothetical protein